MGGNVVVWKQAARAELATTATFRIGYGQALLDLVMALDKIPHWLIVREAIALGFPLWFGKLFLAIYKLTRVIWIQQVVPDTWINVRVQVAAAVLSVTSIRCIGRPAKQPGVKYLAQRTPQLRESRAC